MDCSTYILILFYGHVFVLLCFNFCEHLLNVKNELENLMSGIYYCFLFWIVYSRAIFFTILDLKRLLCPAIWTAKQYETKEYCNKPNPIALLMYNLSHYINYISSFGNFKHLADIYLSSWNNIGLHSWTYCNSENKNIHILGTMLATSYLDW